MTIALRGAGAWASGSTAPAPTIPAGTLDGDLMLLYVGCKPFSATINTPAGWTLVSGTNGNNGSVASGIDTGSVLWACFQKTFTPGIPNPTISVTSGNVSLAVIKSFSKTAGSWETPTGAKGSDTSSGTGFSLTMDADPGIINNDMLATFATIAGNDSTFGTPTLTATGATFGTVTESPATEGTTTTGNDLESSASHALCTAGPGTAAPVVGWTLSVAQTGGGCIVRLREVVSTAQAGTYASVGRGGGIDPNLPLGLRGNIGRPGPGRPGITRLVYPEFLELGALPQLEQPPAEPNPQSALRTAAQHHSAQAVQFALIFAANAALFGAVVAEPFVPRQVFAAQAQQAFQPAAQTFGSGLPAIYAQSVQRPRPIDLNAQSQAQPPAAVYGAKIQQLLTQGVLRPASTALRAQSTEQQAASIYGASVQAILSEKVLLRPLAAAATQSPEQPAPTWLGGAHLHPPQPSLQASQFGIPDRAQMSGGYGRTFGSIPVTPLSIIITQLAGAPLQSREQAPPLIYRTLIQQFIAPPLRSAIVAPPQLDPSQPPAQISRTLIQQFQASPARPLVQAIQQSYQDTAGRIFTVPRQDRFEPRLIAPSPQQYRDTTASIFGSAALTPNVAPIVVRQIVTLELQRQDQPSAQISTVLIHQFIAPPNRPTRFAAPLQSPEQPAAVFSSAKVEQLIPPLARPTAVAAAPQVDDPHQPSVFRQTPAPGVLVPLHPTPPASQQVIDPVQPRVFGNATQHPPAQIPPNRPAIFAPGQSPEQRQPQLFGAPWLFSPAQPAPASAAYGVTGRSAHLGGAAQTFRYVAFGPPPPVEPPPQRPHLFASGQSPEQRQAKLFKAAFYPSVAPPTPPIPVRAQWESGTHRTTEALRQTGSTIYATRLISSQAPSALLPAGDFAAQPLQTPSVIRALIFQQLPTNQGLLLPSGDFIPQVQQVPPQPPASVFRTLQQQFSQPPLRPAIFAPPQSPEQRQALVQRTLIARFETPPARPALSVQLQSPEQQRPVVFGTLPKEFEPPLVGLALFATGQRPEQQQPVIARTVIGALQAPPPSPTRTATGQSPEQRQSAITRAFPFVFAPPPNRLVTFATGQPIEQRTAWIATTLINQFVTPPQRPIIFAPGQSPEQQAASINTTNIGRLDAPPLRPTWTVPGQSPEQRQPIVARTLITFTTPPGRPTLLARQDQPPQLGARLFGQGVQFVESYILRPTRIVFPQPQTQQPAPVFSGLQVRQPTPIRRITAEQQQVPPQPAAVVLGNGEFAPAQPFPGRQAIMARGQQPENRKSVLQGQPWIWGTTIPSVVVPKEGGAHILLAPEIAFVLQDGTPAYVWSSSNVSYALVPIQAIYVTTEATTSSQTLRANAVVHVLDAPAFAFVLAEEGSG